MNNGIMDWMAYPLLTFDLQWNKKLTEGTCIWPPKSGVMFIGQAVCRGNMIECNDHVIVL